MLPKAKTTSRTVEDFYVRALTQILPARLSKIYEVIGYTSPFFTRVYFIQLNVYNEL